MIHYQLTQDDFFAFQKNFIGTSPYHKRFSRFYTAILSLLAAYLGFALVIILLPRTISSAPLILALAVSASVLSVLLQLRFSKKMYQNMTLWQFRYMLKKNTKWPRDVTLYFNEFGVEVNSLHNRVNKRIQVAWEAIERVSEDETNYYLYLEVREAIIVPKQNNTLSETEQTKINDLLQKHLSISF
ncbi:MULTISPECIES: YcxB family protein [unclassified Exiguobacterium]|uniref:YcxB family protein n=1 Tax=unclassified Exiguobacterium TaxID=2644629 RepID=UPI00104063D0|nr:MULTISPECIES: YcxB family protein [unclassified Exiguobacterium]TCI47943.1 YcxB family protein [Exiguobacterium sp. SH5S32]TCI54825.1 YcxB family protein [Exiguobacterium sp. SH1S4]TCI74622.1 YcxB family protein [Exiguobacterium sp. SH1S1]TCI80912.1 YcxB family protein [Exiguobacterium sp. SH0S1]